MAHSLAWPDEIAHNLAPRREEHHAIPLQGYLAHKQQSEVPMYGIAFKVRGAAKNATRFP